MGSALGCLRRADESCSLARTAAVEQLHVVEDIQAGVLAHVVHAVIVMAGSSDSSWIFALGASFTCTGVDQRRLPRWYPDRWLFVTSLFVIRLRPGQIGN